MIVRGLSIAAINTVMVVVVVSSCRYHAEWKVVHYDVRATVAPPVVVLRSTVTFGDSKRPTRSADAIGKKSDFFKLGE